MFAVGPPLELYRGGAHEAYPSLRTDHRAGDGLTCHGHRTKTYYCAQVCLDCNAGYCGCFGDHCCCIEPVHQLASPAILANGRLAPVERLNARAQEERKERLAIQEQLCNCGVDFCGTVAMHLYKGEAGPGFDRHGMRYLLRNSGTPGGDRQATVIYDRMVRWLLAHPRVPYRSHSFAEDQPGEKAVYARGPTYLHRQPFVQYRAQIQAVFIPALASIIASYCSQH